ncbi:replication-relaxation family protein [Arthrobacter sp. MI7-26]|uniref:replication-relaxation family protein n=1 Tax=Arthrobacter sp. MI7-26 TaxID=2993653 RepID=UPI002248D17B|nr:replication-relaxation family protein [Arthrobacter sp. MI7-26]MCX2746248.1 replication-relaxation family protein [Arthrobacter sp. MI7-26]
MNDTNQTLDEATGTNSDGGHPVARPTAATKNADERPNGAPEATLRMGTDPPVGRTQAAVTRTSKYQRREILAQLSARDRGILLGLAAHRYLTTTQLQRLFFHDHKSPLAATRATVRVLQRLHGHQLVTRLERRVGGFSGGSTAFVWAVTDTGEKAIGDLKGIVGRRRNNKVPSARHLEHLLAVTDARLELIEADRAGDFTITKTEMEPDCWRPYLNRHGQPAHIKPDLYAVTQTPEYEDHWMIEVDRDTEHLPVITRKCLAVQLYHDRGIEQERHGVFPLTVWVVPDEARRRKIEAAVTKEPGLSNELFRVVEMTDLAALVAAGGNTPTTNKEGGK